MPPGDRVGGQTLARVRLPLSVLFPAMPWVALATGGLLAIGLPLVGVPIAEAIRLAAGLGLGMGALVGIGSPVYAVTSPVRVTTLGVAAYNAWDRRILDFVPWATMKEAEETRLFGVRYLRVRDGAGRALWIPYGVLRDPAFTAAVRSASEVDSPLRRYVDERVPATTG